MGRSFFQDLRYGLRMLAKSPAFTAIAIATLALGIGLNTTLFTVFDAVALKPLPLRDADTLMRLERWFVSGRIGSAQYLFSWEEYKYLKQHSHSLPEMIAVSNPVPVSSVLPAIGGSKISPYPERLTGQLVSANYFSQLAVNAVLGRTFTADENSIPGGHPIAVLSFPFWEREFNLDPSVVGAVLTLNGTQFTVIGIAPRDFIGTANPPQIPDFWAPLMMQAQLVPGQDWLNDPFDQELQLLGHEIQVTPPAGASELTGLLLQFQRVHPNPHLSPNADPATTGRAITTRVSMQHATLFGNTEDLDFRLIVALLMTVVGLVLLIACANLANMLLARATGRQREIGVRMALGASRGRLIRQLLTESVLLALFGGAAGLILSVWAGHLLWAAIAPFLGRLNFVIPTSPDSRIFIYTLLISIVTGIIFGLSPALQASRAGITGALKDSETLIGRGWKRKHLRAMLVAGQVAISLMFLVAAGLLARGLVRAGSAAPGYETQSIYLMPLQFGNDPQQASVRARRVIDRLQSLPQIENSGVVERPPMMWTWTIDMHANDSTSPKAPDRSLANHVSGSYFPTMGIEFVRGRTFSRSEEQFGAPVTILSEATAHSLWPGQDPIGKHVNFVITPNGPWTQYEVVGVVKDVRTANLSRPDPAMVYFPASDSDISASWLAMRIRGDAHAALTAIGAALAPVDVRFTGGFYTLNLENGVVRIQKLISQTLSLSAGSLALLALLLAAVGIYGVAAFMVSQREHEVGVRMALGALPRDLWRLLVRDGMRPVMAGGIIGLLGAFAVSAILKATLVFPGSIDFLYGVGSFDPVTFIVLSGAIGLIAFAACYIPARRAAHVDPMVVLRHQ